MITCIFEDGGKGNLRHAVVDSLLIKDNKILLVKRAENLLQGGKWGLVGGYVEMDENIREAAEREALEETGYKVKNPKLFTIADDPEKRNDPRFNIAFVFICEVLEKEGQADKESSEQKWFELDSLPKENEMAFDHFKLINLYLKNKNNPLPKIASY